MFTLYDVINHAVLEIQKIDKLLSSSNRIFDGNNDNEIADKNVLFIYVPVRSEDHIDSEETRNCEDTDVVVTKMEEKGRFARIFQSIKDKENSCMGRGKVIEEKAVGNIKISLLKITALMVIYRASTDER